MADTLLQLFERRAAYFLAGDFARLAGFFRYPCAAYFENELVVIKSPTQLAAILARYKRVCDGAHVAALIPDVVALTPRRNGKQSVWVRWTHVDQYGQMVSQNQCRYMLSARSTDPFPIVELMEYGEFSYEAEMFGIPIRRIA